MKDFNGSPLPGTYAGNRLKKFIEREGFYKAVSPNDKEPEQGSEEEENDREIGDENEDGITETRVGEATLNSEDKEEISGYLQIDFEILLPELDENQREEYTQYIE